jgi:hypothetical protein
MSVAETSLTPRREEHRSRGLAWPILLIALGVIFLLETSGFLNDALRRQLVELWPFALVLLGADLLLRDRSTAAQLAVDAAVVAAAALYLVVALPNGFATTANYQSSVIVPRESAEELNLTVSYGAGRFGLSGGLSSAPAALVNVDSTQSDIRVTTVVRSGSLATVTIEPDRDTFPFARGDRAWNVKVPSDLPATLTLNLGAGTLRADLSEIRVRRATINHGASELTLIPPKPTGDVAVTLASGASSIVIEIPPGLEYRVRTSGAVLSIGGLQESAGYAQAATSVAIR